MTTLQQPIDLESAKASPKNPDPASTQTSIPPSIFDRPDPDEGKSEEERKKLDAKLLRKIDFWLIPWLSLIYLLSFLDRTNIGNARLAGMEDDLDMHNTDYNISLTVFFVSYAITEPVTNLLLKKTTPRIFFTIIVLAWGIVSTLTGIVTSFGGLLAARFFLGIAQAGLFPGVEYYLSCWYKSSEIGLRSALFFSAAALAGSFGGVLAALIAKMDGLGGKPGWAWIFIIEGLATVIAGVLCLWMIFDWPETAQFLTPEERLRVQRRLLAGKQSTIDEKTSGKKNNRLEVMEAFKDWKTYGYGIIYAGCMVPLYGFSLFLPTIVQGMGHSGTRAQLLTVPPYAVAAIMTVVAGFVADRTGWRGYTNIVTSFIGIVGFIMLMVTSNSQVQYAGTFLGCLGIYAPVPNTLAWVANNFEGEIKRAVVLGLVAGFGSLNGIVSSNIYMKHDKPRYFTGHGVVLAYQVLFVLGGSITMHFMLRLENNRRRSGKRAGMLAGKTEAEIQVAGDKRPEFMYTL